MKYLFIDSNIWLSLYHYSNNDLKELGKIKDYLGKEVIIILTRQVIDEVSRNRETKINDALKEFKFLDIKFPTYTKSYTQYSDFKEKYGKLRDEFNEWVKAIKKDVAEDSLPADIIISEIFSLVDVIEINDEIYNKAVRRYNLGNPPGKNNSYGDAVNWEVVLEKVPDGEDLYFISDDKDFKSEINSKELNHYLQEEWENRKGTKIYYFNTLPSFVKEHLDNVILQNERDREDLISALCESASFASTHAFVAQLKKYDNWSLDDVDRMCKAAINNNQIGWILNDDDIKAFYLDIIDSIFLDDMSDNMLDVFSRLTDEELF